MAKQQIQTYGLEAEKGEDWLKQVLKQPNPQLIIELQGFGRPRGTEALGGISKEQHAKNFIREHYPWVWQYWNDWLDLIFWAWCNYEEIGATGCMGSGKSYGFSLAAWMEWISAPTQTACVLSSTTKDAIRARLWTHIKKLRGGLVINGKQCSYPCHLVDSRTMIQAAKGDDMHAIMSVAVQGGKMEDAIGNIQGRHPERMVVFCDEGEQTPDAIFSARFNLRAGTKLFRFVSAANAVNPSSAYGQFIEPKAGWSSARDSDEQWESKSGIVLHFDGLKSPNVRAGKVVVPGLIQQSDIDPIVTSKGVDSLEYWMYVRGFPPMSGVRNTVLTWAHILTNKAQDKVVWQDSTRWLAALDPAFTSGGDDCVLRLARTGLRDDGTRTLWLEPPIKIQFQESSGVPVEYQIADRIKEECESRKIPPADFAMDSTAATALASIIEQRWQPGFRRINYGSGATERKMPGEEKTGKERCKNRVAEMWFAFAALVRSGQVRGLDPEAAQEFCTRQYSLQGEKYLLESKADMKTRTGGKSPDVADATVQLGDLFRDIAGIDGGPAGKAAEDAWEKAAAQFNLMEQYA